MAARRYQLALIGHVAGDPRREESVELIGRENPGVDPSGSGADPASSPGGSPAAPKPPAQSTAARGPQSDRIFSASD